LGLPQEEAAAGRQLHVLCFLPGGRRSSRPRAFRPWSWTWPIGRRRRESQGPSGAFGRLISGWLDRLERGRKR